MSGRTGGGKNQNEKACGGGRGFGAQQGPTWKNTEKKLCREERDVNEAEAVALWQKSIRGIFCRVVTTKNTGKKGVFGEGRGKH